MDEGASLESACYGSQSPYHLLFRAVSMLPITHVLLGALSLLLILLFNLFETHFLHNIVFRGEPVSLTFNSSSQLYHSVVSKCRLLHSRYMATPWLSSPHLQTAFLSFFGNAPDFNYRRELFRTSDGGTIALDWLMSSDVKVGSNDAIEGVPTPRDENTPIMIVIPGLSSDSSAAYIKHLVLKLMKSGSDVVVSNHRGLGGISITSDCFYNAGWTEDIRALIDHLHHCHPQTPLFVIGTSIGANVLVKYLGEQGENVAIAGAAAVCSPWDLLICDRFINRKPVQKFYDKALTSGLQCYAKMHQNILSRLANWEGIQNSRSLREFDNHATRILGKYETVDTFYRRCSSVNFMGKVAVPLLCISSLDDPVCTKEAIPWDECRANENIVLATTPHGGHLGFYEGLTASSLWWVRAVDEYLNILKSSPLMHRRPQTQSSLITTSLETPINEGPYINVTEGGMVVAAGENETDHGVEEDEEANAPQNRIQEARGNDSHEEGYSNDVLIPMKRRMDQLARNSRRSLWLLAYIAIATTWPLVGSAMVLAFKRKFPKIGTSRVL